MHPFRLFRKGLAHKARPNSGSITELPLALYAFMLVIVFPLIDMLGVATGAAIVYLSTNESATRAANQRRYSDSLNDMLQTSTLFTKNGFANFAKMQAIGGYGGSGADLYIDANNTKNDTVTSYGPNTTITAAIDQTTYVYEARVNSSFECGPLINLGFMPFLGSVQGLGTPAIINFSSSKQVEYPGGMEIAAAASGGAWPTFSTTSSPNEASSGGGTYSSGWNMPTIYSQIAAAGQTVVSSTTIQVPANNVNPTDTSLSLAAGQNLWIDLRSNGSWSTGTSITGVVKWGDANGYSPANPWWSSPNPSATDPTAPENSLIGKVGSNPYFVVGTSYQNYAPNQTGEFVLVENDESGAAGYADNMGVQTARVIITR